MKFSVVVPVCNVERYLPDALDSLRNQTFEDFEVILIDDGSSDRSGEMCDEFVKTSLIPTKVIHQENKGLLAARSIGLMAASGDYIVSLDGDDCLRKDALALINAAIDQTGSDVVCYAYSRKKDYFPCSFNLMHEGYCYNNGEVKALFCKTNRMNPLCFKAIARRCIGYDNNFDGLGRLNMGEDAVRSCVVFDRANRVSYINQALYYYRPNDSSVSSSVSIAHLLDLQRVHCELLRHAKQWDSETSCVSNYYKTMLGRCIEEICHFSLHYPAGKRYTASVSAFERASNLDAVLDSSHAVLDYCRPHTKIVLFLLRRRHFRMLWIMSCMNHLVSRGLKDGVV